MEKFDMTGKADYDRRLKKINREFPGKITPKRVQIYLMSIKQKYAASTLGSVKAAIKYSLRLQLFQSGEMDLLRRFEMAIDMVKTGPRAVADEYLSKSEVQTVAGLAHRRLRLLIYFLWYSGARIGEACSVLLASCKIDTDKQVVYCSANWKGGRKGDLPAIPLWLYQEIRKAFGSSIYLFEPDKRGKSLSYSVIYRWFRGMSKKIGRRIHPHMIRHSAATHLYEVTKDIRKVSSFLRHKELATTMRYIHDRETSENAIEHLQLDCDKQGVAV